MLVNLLVNDVEMLGYFALAVIVLVAIIVVI